MGNWKRIKRFSEQIFFIIGQITAFLIEAGVIWVGIQDIDGTRMEIFASLDANITGKPLADQPGDAIRETIEDDAHDDLATDNTLRIDDVSASFRPQQQHLKNLERAVARRKYYVVVSQVEAQARGFEAPSPLQA